ncbi:hypothetical protein CRYUN_Cryun05aG0273100 [Craigia yunnanensis]
MLVQRRDDLNEDDDLHLHHNQYQETAASSGRPMIKIKVAHARAQHELFAPPILLSVLFRGKEKEDKEHLHLAGVKDKSKVLVLEKVQETTASKENKVEEMMESEEMSKALVAVAGVRKEVDKLSERVAALEVAMNNGTKVAGEEFDVSAELLMRELLKLDGIEAEGDAKLQRKAEVGQENRCVNATHKHVDIVVAIYSSSTILAEHHLLLCAERGKDFVQFID